MSEFENIEFNIFCNKWSFVPTVNTCSATLFLRKGSYDLPLPTDKEQFEVYDFSFSNSYFGMQNCQASVWLTLECNHEANFEQDHLHVWTYLYRVIS